MDAANAKLLDPAIVSLVHLYCCLPGFVVLRSIFEKHGREMLFASPYYFFRPGFMASARKKGWDFSDAIPNLIAGRYLRPNSRHEFALKISFPLLRAIGQKIESKMDRYGIAAINYERIERVLSFLWKFDFKESAWARNTDAEFKIKNEWFFSPWQARKQRVIAMLSWPSVPTPSIIFGERPVIPFFLRNPCMICLDEGTKVWYFSLTCDHFMCSDCISAYFSQHTAEKKPCPYCRRPTTRDSWWVKVHAMHTWNISCSKYIMHTQCMNIKCTIHKTAVCQLWVLHCICYRVWTTLQVPHQCYSTRYDER